MLTDHLVRLEFHQRVLVDPDDKRVVSMVAVGHPAEEKEPRTNYDETKVHWQKYGPQA